MNAHRTMCRHPFISGDDIVTLGYSKTKQKVQWLDIGQTENEIKQVQGIVTFFVFNRRPLSS